MAFRRPATIFAASFAVVIMAAATAACSGRSTVVSPSLPPTNHVVSQTRTAKSSLIQRLTSAPQVVIFGGSRAMRFDPAYVKRRTGLSGFNAAVMRARPEDTWALLNQLHTRFPTARFRFLWVIHADEFDRRPIDPAILTNPILARYFPAALVKSQMSQAVAQAQRRQNEVTLDVPDTGKLVYALDGFVLSGFFSDRTPPPNGNVGAIGARIRKALLVYGRTPAVLYPRSVRYFEKDLRLMDALAATPPVIVAAPFDRRIYAATVNRGWGARHRLLTALLARLRPACRFSYLDMSNAASRGITPSDYYDGIHLTPRGGQKVIDRVLKAFPGAL
jgi:hypothetical protein